MLDQSPRHTPWVLNVDRLRADVANPGTALRYGVAGDTQELPDDPYGTGIPFRRPHAGESGLRGDWLERPQHLRAGM